jgi:hypothetical protein
VSEVKVRLRHSHGHQTPARLIDLTPHLLRRRAAPVPPVELREELTSHRVQGVAETDCSWGLLLVPISVCVALFVYASLFFT